MLEDKWSWKRFWMICLILLATALLSLYVFLNPRYEVGQRLLAVICGLMFAVFFTLYLEWNRLRQGIYHEKANNFVRIALFYTGAAVVTAAISYLPGSMRPVILAPAMMVLVLDPFAGLMCGGYFAVILCLTQTADVASLSCYLLLGMFGCVLVPFFQKKENKGWGCFMIFCTSFCLNALFSILGQGQVTLWSLLESLAGAAISCVGIALLFWLCNDRIKNSRELMLAHIIDEDYELVEMMRSYAKADYEHAKRVSLIAKGCAQRVGADPMLCETAGFYYRIGRLEGKPYVRNGVALARKRSFPPEVIQILAEYNGEEQLPSTLESALIHITDSVVAKFDILDKSTLSSSWNQDIIIYQTMNENSARGLYDRSGLGMNMFLLIRDYLVKEVPLYDSYHRKQQ